MRRAALFTILLLTLAAVPVLVSPASAATATGYELLADLPVKAESTAVYDRAYFEHWIDADSDCHDTRAEVLLAESRAATTESESCTVLTGSWYSSYDGETWTSASDVDIDHVVAWRSGASMWSAGQRRAYANDLADGR